MYEAGGKPAVPAGAWARPFREEVTPIRHYPQEGCAERLTIQPLQKWQRNYASEYPHIGKKDAWRERLEA
jgi:hypothetical protein